MFDDLISKLPELYQDIEVGGKVVAKGKRNCKDRWELIKKHIRPHDVILDLGSSVGYFAHRIAKEYPDSLVISFESNPEMCEIQKRIFEHEGIYNVIVCNHRLSREDLEKWVRHVECFDVVLVLAVVHHYRTDDIYSVYSSLIELAPVMITEVPTEAEQEAHGTPNWSRARQLIDTGIGFVGKVSSHLGDYDRKVYVKRFAIGPPVREGRENLDAYFGVSHGGRHQFELTYGRSWLLNGKHIINGINVWNLLHFNVVWPKKTWWKVQVRKAYEGLEFKSDVRFWNLLVTSTGLRAFDYIHKYPEGDQAEFRESDYWELDEKLDDMLS